MATPIDEIKNLKKLAAEAKAEMDKLVGSSQGLERAAIKAEKSYRDQVKILRDANEQVSELLSNQKLSIDAIMQQEARLKGLTGLQASLVDLDRDRLTLQDKIDGSHAKTHAALNSIASLNQELLSLSSEDIIARQHIEKSISDQLYDLIGMEGVTDEIVENLDKQFEKAKGISSMTEKQQKFLTKQLEVYQGLKDTIGGVFETLSLITSGPLGALGMGFIGAGFAADKLGKNIRSFGGFIDSAQFSALGLGFIFDDAEETAKSLSKEFGGLKDITLSTQLNTNLMATNMGISGQEAASIVGSFARMNDGSAATAMDMAATTKEMAKAAGVPVDQVMKDVASSTEAFAEYGKDGGINIAKAAVNAAQLGVSMDAMTKVTDSLLDFETSINSELALGAMLGKNINLDRARGLAYEGKIGGAVKETLQQLGGIEGFNKMDIFSKREAAKLLGLSVSELEKMAANSDKLNDDGTVQLSTFDSITEAITASATASGGFLKTIGGGLMAMGQMSPILKDIGIDMGGMVKTSAGVLKNLLGMVAGPVISGIKAIGGGLANAFGGTKLAESIGGIKDKLMSVGSSIKDKLMDGVGDKAKDKLTDLGQDKLKDAKLPEMSGGDKAASSADKLGKINGMALLQAAAAMLVMAAALFVTAKAFQEFDKIENVGNVLLMFGATLIGFTGALMLLSTVATPLLPILFPLAAAFLAFGGAIMLAGLGMKFFGEGVNSISGTLPTMVEPLLQLSQINFLPILGLAASLGVLAVALLAVSTAGLMALPILAGLGLIAGGVGLMGGGEEGGSTDRTGELIDEIKGLRADLIAGKIAVNIDGQKVTSNVGKVVSRLSTNSYAKV